jgi:hypothetical protein
LSPHERSGCPYCRTGVAFPTPTAAAAGASTSPAPGPTPAALTLQSTSLALDTRGRITPTLACSSGDAGCAGTLTATRGKQTLGSGTIVLTAKPVIGTSPSQPTPLIVTSG